jgi:aryl-alcohol dehydrogenase-like predicted oxidoreductase
MRRSHPRFHPDNMKRNLILVDRLKAVSAQQGCSAAQLSLAWLLHRRDFIVPVPGTRQLRWLEENAKAADLVPSRATISTLDEIFAPTAVAGARYPDGLLSRVHL